MRKHALTAAAYCALATCMTAGYASTAPSSQQEATTHRMSDIYTRTGRPANLVPVLDKLDQATTKQLLDMARGGIGEPINDTDRTAALTTMQIALNLIDNDQA